MTKLAQEPSYLSFKQIVRRAITEGLISTYDENKVKLMLQRRYSLGDDNVAIVDGENGTQVVCVILPYVKFSANDIGDVKHFMQTCGYFQSFKKDEVKEGFVYLWFEQKFPNDITDKVHEKYEYLYHFLPDVYVERVKTQGLVPKSKNKQYLFPDRVYMMLGDELTDAHKELWKSLKKEREANKNFKSKDKNTYSVAKIDVSKLPMDIRFYYDPMAENAVYTYDNIPKEAIISIKELEL